MPHYLKQILILLIILLLTLSASLLYDKFSPPSHQAVWNDLAYSDISPNNKLDIYFPDKYQKKYPVVIWIHGGAIKFGDKKEIQSLDRMLQEGFAVVSINYRLSGEAGWPAQLEDMRNAILFVKKNAAKYRLDQDHIAVWGASAGGYLASIIGTALSSDPDTRVNAIIDWYGYTDFYHLDEDMDASGIKRATGRNGDADSAESAFIGVTIKDNKTLADQATPLYYLEKTASDIPPFLIMHGGRDNVIADRQSERLYDAIIKKFGAAKAAYIFYPDADHGSDDFQTKEATDQVINFLKTQL
jgi:acetyl esterase/lipase